MAQAFYIETDVSQVQQALLETSQSMTSIQRQTLGVISRGTVKVIKAAILETTTKRTGELAKGYRYKIKKDGTEANVFPKTDDWGSSIFPKAAVLSYVHEGPTKRAKSFTVYPRGFVQAGKAWVDSGGYSSDLDKMIDKQLTKFWGN